MVKVKLAEKVDTSFTGYKKLITFYQACKAYNNEEIDVDFSELEWIDANLCALFMAIFFKLSKENNLSFYTDGELLDRKFDVLYRNGFAKSHKKVEDVQKSTMPAMRFQWSEKNNFVEYIETQLLSHRGMPSISDGLREQIMDDLIEVFCNANHHADTQEPFFVSGQYYPKQKSLRFTMVDLGQGFLPRILKATHGKIDTSLKAIQWALEGNSSKLVLENTSGGLGLSNMLKYCKENKGELEVITGDGYWSSNYESESNIFKGGRELGNHTFVGTTINLAFKQ